ncbi:MAG TPA: PorV/PorQ family protein [bacterium (Candidatus Stahlbacteria)]|nr:PorV/PorQ family protein [Candidatus Stahlbacteria bacterium]
MRKAVLAIFVLVPCILYAQYERPGSTSGQFLKIGVSARAIGMGEAFTAVANDASSIFYNPAGLARIEVRDILLTHTKWFASINYDFAGIAHKLPRAGAVAIFFGTLYTDAMEVRTPLRPEGTGELFYATDYVAGISYARFLTDRAALGLNFKYIRLNLMDYAVDTWAADLGTFFQTGWRSARFGMRMANFGPHIKFITEPYSLPISFTLGVAMEIIEGGPHTLTLGVMGIKPTDAAERASVGVEYWFQDMFALRGGYKIGYDAESWSFGVGFKTRMGKATAKIDYAYSEFGFLTQAHRISMGFAF